MEIRIASFHTHACLQVFRQVFKGTGFNLVKETLDYAVIEYHDDTHIREVMLWISSGIAFGILDNGQVKRK